SVWGAGTKGSPGYTLTSRRNRSSSICRNTYAIGKVRPPLGGLDADLRRCLVQQVCWSVSSPTRRRSRIRRTADRGPDTEMTARDPCPEPSRLTCVGPRAASRVRPGFFNSGWMRLRAALSTPVLRSNESGGDEETRTPDPLLAKEM